MHINEVMRGVNAVRRSGPQVEITGIEYDSRRIVQGALFLAMRGGTTDGNRYIASAIERGASAVVTDTRSVFDEIAQKYPQITVAEVPHGRSALAILSANFFEHP